MEARPDRELVFYVDFRGPGCGMMCPGRHAFSHHHWCVAFHEVLHTKMLRVSGSLLPVPVLVRCQACLDKYGLGDDEPQKDSV